MTCQASRSSEPTRNLFPVGRDEVTVRPGRRAAKMHSATTRNDTTSTSNAHTAATAAITGPARALPAKDATCLMVENSPFAIASAEAPASCGTMEAPAGRRNVVSEFRTNTAPSAAARGRWPRVTTIAARLPTASAASRW